MKFYKGEENVTDNNIQTVRAISTLWKSFVTALGSPQFHSANY